MTAPPEPPASPRNRCFESSRVACSFSCLRVPADSVASVPTDLLLSAHAFCTESTPASFVPHPPAVRRCVQRLSCVRRVGLRGGVSGGVGSEALITAPPEPPASL